MYEEKIEIVANAFMDRIKGPYVDPVEKCMIDSAIGFGNIPPEKAPGLVQDWFLKNPEKVKILKSREKIKN